MEHAAMRSAINEIIEKRYFGIHNDTGITAAPQTNAICKAGAIMLGEISWEETIEGLWQAERTGDLDALCNHLMEISCWAADAAVAFAELSAYASPPERFL